MMEKVENYITGYIKGKTPKMLFDKEENGCLPYLSPDYLRNISQPESYAQPDSKLVVVNEGEVIVLWDGSNAGEIFISKKGILASTMTLLEFDENEIDKNYFGYSFQQLEYILKAKTAGSGIPHADKGVINKLNFYKPSLPEQASIANILSKVDEAIESVKKSIEAAEKLKKSLMQNLLTGRMKPDGTLRTEDEFYEDEKFGKVPKGWEVGRFKKFSILQRGSDLTDKEVVSGIYPVVKSNGISIYHNQYFVKPPGVVTGRSGTIGKAFYIEDNFWAHNTTLYVKDFKNNVPKYIFYLILSMNFERYYAGTTVPTLNRNDIHKLKVMIPKISEEQQKIVSILDAINKIIKDKKDKVYALERLKKSLMQNLLTGKVRVWEDVK